MADEVTAATAAINNGMDAKTVAVSAAIDVDEDNDDIDDIDMDGLTATATTETAVREYLEPSASDQNSTPPRSPMPPHSHQTHQHHHRPHHRRSTRATIAMATTTTTVAAAAVRANASVDDTDDVSTSTNNAVVQQSHRKPNVNAITVSMSPQRQSTVAMPKVHRRQVAQQQPNSTAVVNSFSDPTASPTLRHKNHQQPPPFLPSRPSPSSASSASHVGRQYPSVDMNATAAFAATSASAAAAAVAAATGSSPSHRKRSKSESRRRRERKMIAAGELEVRQANETLMRYLRQCTEINDASLSGELEIDQSYDDRRVHRKTRSQRERRGFLGHIGVTGGGVHVGVGSVGGVTHVSTSAAAAAAALAAAGGAGAGAAGGVVGARGRLQLQNGLTSILNSLAEDIRPVSGNNGGVGGVGGSAEIYNPFTPVISPSDGAPHMGVIGSKIYVQHPHRHSHGHHQHPNHHQHHRHHHQYRRDGCLDGDDDEGGDDGCFRSDIEHGIEHHTPLVQSIVDMSCTVQRYWILLSNLCHGLLGGLAFAHLLLVLTTDPFDWLSTTAGTANSEAVLHRGSMLAHAYASTFYGLAVVCLVSVFDRMDFCRLNTGYSDSISFRWIIVLMIYLATNILSLSTEATIEHNDFSITNSTEWLERMENNRVLDVWNSLSIVRSVCALLGWLLVGMFPQDDLLYDHLAEMEKHQLN